MLCRLHAAQSKDICMTCTHAAHCCRSYLLNKVLSSLHVHIPAVAQGATEEQGLLDSGSSSVRVKLLHIARHSCKAGLLLGVAVDADVTLNLTSCSHRYCSKTGFVQMQNEEQCKGTAGKQHFNQYKPTYGHLMPKVALGMVRAAGTMCLHSYHPQSDLPLQQQPICMTNSFCTFTLFTER